MAFPLWFGGPPDAPSNESGSSPGDADERRARARDTYEQGSASHATNDSLSARIQAGDARAFEALFREYHPRLLSFAASYAGSVEAGEEVVADVFAWIWEHRATWAPTNGESAYLYGAVRNRAL